MSIKMRLLNILEKLFTKKSLFLLIFAVFFTVVCSLFFNFFSKNFTIAITDKNHICFPYKIWIINKNYKNIENFNYEDYIAFKGKNIPYLKDNISWVKKIIGKPNDEIMITKLDKPKNKIVYLEDKPIELNIVAKVVVNSQNDKYVLDVFKTDTKGRPLTIISPGKISNGKIFVYSPHARSYDSRYWGLVDETQIIGKAYPIF